MYLVVLKMTFAPSFSSSQKPCAHRRGRPRCQNPNRNTKATFLKNMGQLSKNRKGAYSIKTNKRRKTCFMELFFYFRKTVPCV
ncbi:hypothetical protein FKM82_002483 [Ascaphus truei]